MQNLVHLSFLIVAICYYIGRPAHLAKRYKLGDIEATDELKQTTRRYKATFKRYLIAAVIGAIMAEILTLWFQEYESIAYLSLSLMVIIPLYCFGTSGLKYVDTVREVARQKTKGARSTRFDLRIIRIASILLCLLLLTSSGIMLYMDIHGLNIQTTSSSVSIDAPFHSTRFDINDIRTVTLSGGIPKAIRMEGFETEYYAYGTYSLENIGKANMFIHIKSKPYIVVTLKTGQMIILNRKNANDTQALYQYLIANREQ